jgi:hypothetical protein
MHDVGGVWRKDMVWRSKVGATTLPVRRCLAFILRSFEQVLVTIYRRASTSLPGSGSHLELVVTHSKQTMARFLPGSRIGTTHSIYCADSSPLFARSTQSAPRNPHTSLQILPRISAQIFSLD